MVAVSLVGVMIAVVLDLYCIHYCLDDLNRREIVIGGDRRWWTAVIVLGGPLGQAAYWLYGRGEY